jgi:hypothetical protein
MLDRFSGGVRHRGQSALFAILYQHFEIQEGRSGIEKGRVFGSRRG